MTTYEYLDTTTVAEQSQGLKVSIRGRAIPEDKGLPVHYKNLVDTSSLSDDQVEDFKFHLYLLEIEVKL